MTDAQFTILMSVIGTVGAAVAAALRWGLNRIVKALDDNTDSNKQVASSNVEHAKAMTTMAMEVRHVSTKMDTVSDWMQEHTPVETPHDRVTGEPRTPKGGYGLRPGTHDPNPSKR